MECSWNGFIDKPALLSMSEPGILVNFVKVELIVATEAKKLGKARLAKLAAYFRPINA
jgi:hypothetical protein